MVIYKVTPSLTSKSCDGVEGQRGQGHQFISQKDQQQKCPPVMKKPALTAIKNQVIAKVQRMDACVSPVVQRHHSFKYIERNVVQRRTQVFETDPSKDSIINNDLEKNPVECYASKDQRNSNIYVEPKILKTTMASKKPVPSQLALSKNDNKENSDKAALTVAERAKLFNSDTSDKKETDSRGGTAVLKKSASEDSQSAKPPVSPKKPTVARKPTVSTADLMGPSPSDTDSVPVPSPGPVKRPPKPERPPPPPQLKKIQDNASQSPKEKVRSFSDASNNESEASTPKYAKVNKKPSIKEPVVVSTDGDNTKKVFLDNITLKPVEKKLAESVVSSVSIKPSAQTNSQTSSQSTTPSSKGAGPPPKPPRTFAHDDYLAVKALKKKDKETKTMSCVASFDVGEAAGKASHIYEEIKEVKNSKNEMTPVEAPASTATSPEPVIYEKVQDDDRFTVKREIRTNDAGYSYCTVEETNESDKQEKGKFVISRPAPPPPRPPQPSIKSKTIGRKDDSPIVRVNKHSKNLDSKDIIRKKSFSNPAYEDKGSNFIPIKTFRSPDGEMKRYKSDECLYAELKNDSDSPDGKHVSFSDDSPIYQDPVDVIRPKRSISTHEHVPPGTVPATDSEGYAIPDTRRHTYHRQTSEGPWHPPNHKFSTLQHNRTPSNEHTPSRFSRNWTQLSIRRRTAREKVSRAYSVLRKRPVLDENAKEVQPAEESDDGYIPYEPAEIPIAPDFGAGCFRMLSSDDQDSDVDMEEHKRRLKHVNSLKEKTYNAVNWTMSMKRCRFAKLFHYSLVVGLKKNEDLNTYKPYIMASFPVKEKEQVENILNFCFPDADSWRPVTHYSSESYCFVLTHADGSRQYGYCRRLLPPGDSNRLPEVYCVVSPIGAFNMYEQLMQKVESLRKQSPEYPQCLLKAAFSRTFPDPGQEAWINLKLDEKRQTVILKRSLDEKLESISFGPLLSHLSIDTLLKVYASMLLERRIIFTAQHLGTLSTCIQGIISLLYPFTWQHIYIPVLPATLIEICCSPTPFIIGILATSVPKLQDLPLDEVLIVDLDNNNLLRTIGDETKIIPRKIQRALATSLKDDSDPQGSKDTIIFEAFLRLFIETMGHYLDCISTQQDGKHVFQKDLFCRAVSSRSIRMFLEWFVETQMFEVFITDRTEQGIPEDGYFERRVAEYREEMAAESNKFKDNVKQFGKKMISFVRESGGKIKKAFGGSSHVYV